jgi:small subunit ribosomal protein S5
MASQPEQRSDHRSEHRSGHRSDSHGERSHGGRRSDRRSERGDLEDSPFEEQVVKVYRCSTVVKGGRRFSFSALVVVGDRKGQVGMGYGKDNEVPGAVEKAIKAARKNIIKVNLRGRTIPHQVHGKYGASEIALIPGSEGTGVIAGGSVRPVMELAGIQDILTKRYGSGGAKNLVKAAFDALGKLRTQEMVESLRGVSLAVGESQASI